MGVKREERYPMKIVHALVYSLLDVGGEPRFELVVGVQVEVSKVFHVRIDCLAVHHHLHAKNGNRVVCSSRCPVL